MKFLLSCIAAVLLCAVLPAQNVPVQLIPPSPTAYALAKYGDVPVSLYTGVPDITIPVSTLKNRDVAVDVSLSYHGSGIKVDEVASFVGLGWSLNAGGVITRVVRGKAETLLRDGSLFPKRSDIQFYDYEQHPSKSDFIDRNKLYFAATGQLDNEPDLFYFNFLGRTGRFVFDKNGKAVMENQEGIDIQWKWVDDEVQQFILTDEKGTRYEFSDYETTFFPQEGVNRISAWYLSKIVSATGNRISFEYFNPSSSNQLTRSYSTALVEVLPNVTSITPPLNIPFQGVGYSELRLHTISSENGQIEFRFKNERRRDYAPLPVVNPASAALQEIRVSGADGRLLRRFTLSTGYFESNDREKYDGKDTASFNYLNYRLRLDAVQEVASDDTSRIPPYRFIYLGDDDPSSDDPYTLPYRLCPAQDHWGFYNQSYNTHLIPGITAARSIPIPAWYRQFCPPEGPESIFTAIAGGSNREPHAEAVKAGLLSEIHYPTGGYTAFRFESNDFVNHIPGARIGSVTSYPVDGLPVETDYSYQGYSPYNPQDYYFEAYQVSYFYGEVNPRTATLQQFGIPVDPPYGVQVKKYIKITVQPQGILGNGSEVGYTTVTVSQPGRGSTTSVFSSQDHYRDYVDRDYMEEYSADEQNLLDRLFFSEYIDDSNLPGAPLGNVSTRTLSSREWPYPEIYSNSWKRGLLTDRYTRTEDRITLKEEHFDYYHQLRQVVPAFKVIRLENSSGEYVYSKYYVPNTWSKLKSVVTKDYDEKGLSAVTSTTQYFYDNLAHLQPSRIQVSGSDGKTEVTDITYPLDYATGTPFIDDMNSRHLLAYPVEQVRYLHDDAGTRIVSGSVITYKPGGNGLKEQELKLMTSTPIRYTDFNFSNRPANWIPRGGYTRFSPDSAYHNYIRYDTYDEKGNLLQFAMDQNISTTYLWGYNNMYPVAEVKNATRSQCLYTSFEDDGTEGEGHTGTRYHAGAYRIDWQAPDLRSYELSYWYLEGGVWRFSGVLPFTPGLSITAGEGVDDIRICPTDAFMNTYTYDPQVGMTSQTDERNRTTYYEYDPFGRLHLVRDDMQNIIRKICYGYGGQAQGCTVPGKIYWNHAASGSFKSAVCPPGSTSKVVFFEVAAHTHSSMISQEDAERLAQEDLAINGQAFADAHAVCVPTGNCVNCTGLQRNVSMGFVRTDLKYIHPPGNSDHSSMNAPTSISGVMAANQKPLLRLQTSPAIQR